jgi:uncharacterized protein YxeA
MQNIIKKIVVIIIVLSFFQCKTSKFDKKTPFTVVKSHYYEWYGGQKGQKGIKIELIIDNLQDQIEFDFIYFQHYKIVLKKDKTNKILNANIDKSERDFNMNSDSNKEFGNNAPQVSIDLPFKLNKNQAVISYIKNGKNHFYKLTLTKKSKVYYP